MLAEKSHRHVSFVSDLERGLSNPSLKTIFKISGALGMLPREFVELIEKEDIDELI